MYVCIYSMTTRIHTHIHMHICVCIHVYVCVYIYIYIYTHIHTTLHAHRAGRQVTIKDNAGLVLAVQQQYGNLFKYESTGGSEFAEQPHATALRVSCLNLYVCVHCVCVCITVV